MHPFMHPCALPCPLNAGHSDGFPLAKAQRYAELRHPFLINDLNMQMLLMDRRQVRV